MLKDTENWLKIAKYDLKTAEVAFRNKLYLKVVENCHSSLEKLLKGIITSRGEIPLKIHDLLALASTAVIENLQKDALKIMDELNDFYMSTRYPGDFDIIEEEISKGKAGLILKSTRKTFKWLEKQVN